MSKRGFRCSVQDGSSQGLVSVWIDTDEVARLGDGAATDAAKREWSQHYGCNISTNCHNVQAQVLEELKVPPQ